MQMRLRWVTYSVLAAGVALRLGLAIITPPERAYDDHYEPVQFILANGEIPSAADCWECYQPPLYYVISAALCSATQRVAATSADSGEHVGRRTLQFVSLVAGCATLWVCVLIFRRFSELAAHEALALSLVAFLPRHIYMSAMATNDALTYLLASLAVYAALRAHAANWQARWCIATGLLAGATVLCKGYGWVTVGAITLAVWIFTRHSNQLAESRFRRELSKPLALVLIAALPLAIWPTVRNVLVYGKPHVDNFDMFPETPMRHQPPGSVRETSFLSFRLAALLRHPWLHVVHVDSFWTQFYGRLWFDYEGFNTTLAPYPPWQRLWERCAREHPLWNRARQEMLLSYAPNEVPPSLRRVAVLAYLAGLPLTLGVLAGLVIALRRMGRDFGMTLLSVHFVLAVFVPVFQTLRLPHFAAMKAAFALSGLATAPVLLGLVLSSIRGRAVGRIVAGLLWVFTAAIVLVDVAFVILQFRVAGVTGS